MSASKNKKAKGNRFITPGSALIIKEALPKQRQKLIIKSEGTKL